MVEILQAFLWVSPLLLAWVACFWLWRQIVFRKTGEKDFRFISVLASVTWGTLLAFLIEALSLFHCLTKEALLQGWICADIGLLAAVLYFRRRSRPTVNDMSAARGGGIRMTVEARMIALLIAFTMGLLFQIALQFPTTNYDSLTYHLPRVQHWAQQQSVEHFATNNDRQIQFAPWSSYVFLNLFLLSSGDALFNLLQWGAMVGSVLVVSLLAELLLSTLRRGAPISADTKRVAGLWGALFAVTLPTGIVESTTTQNDYSTAFWVLCSVLLIYRSYSSQKRQFYLAFGAAACGLAVLTKSTAFIYLAPFVVAAGLDHWWRMRPLWLRVRLIITCLACFLAVNVGHMARNVELYRSPIGSALEFKTQRNETFTATGTIANALRNVLLNTNTGFDPVTRALNGSVLGLYWLTGRSLNDPETSYPVGHCFALDSYRLYDSYASNPYHLALVLFTLGIAVWKLRFFRPTLGYIIAAVASVALFCIYLRWQMWHTRFHLTYFLLFAPVVAIVVAMWFAPRWRLLVAGVLGMVALFGIAKNESRPLFSLSFHGTPSEKQLLWVHQGHLSDEIGNIADVIVKHRWQNVGLKLAYDDPEYVFWVTLRRRGFTGSLHHVLVTNESVIKGGTEPVAIVACEDQLPVGVGERFPGRLRLGRYVILTKPDQGAAIPLEREPGQDKPQL